MVLPLWSYIAIHLFFIVHQDAPIAQSATTVSNVLIITVLG
jgi:hypothetical protein